MNVPDSCNVTVFEHSPIMLNMRLMLKLAGMHCSNTA